MYDKRIHSRTIFHVRKSAVSDYEDVFQILVSLTGRWLKRYFHDSQKQKLVSKPWLYRGGTLVVDNVKVEVRTKDYDDNKRSASMWLLRLEHKDSDFSFRIWRTDVGINFYDSDEADVAISTHWGLQGDFLGEEPPIPSVSSPLLVKWIVDNTDLVCSNSNKRISVSSSYIKVGDGRDIYSFIVSEDRDVPVVIMNFKDYQNEVSADGLQKLLTGSAVVLYYDDYIVHEELQNEWGDKFAKYYQCAPDTIRIYQTGINKNNFSDWKRHRFFLLKEYGGNVQYLIRILVQSILRINAQKIRSTVVYDFEALDTIQQQERLKGLKEAASNSEKSEADKEYIAALEDENTRLTQENRTYSDKKSDTDEQLISQEIMIEDLQSKLSQSQQQFREVATTQEHISSAISTFKDLRQKWKKLPKDISSLLDTFASLSSDRLVILDEAKRSAQDCDFDNLEDVWKLLMSMTDELYSLHFEEEGGNIEGLFKQKSGFGLTLKEGSQTKNDNKLMAQRKRIYNGEEIDISAHTKIDRGGKNFRVYYYPDHKRNIIVIGHIGNHLQTAGSQRRRER